VTLNAVTHTQDHMHIRSFESVDFDASFPLRMSVGVTSAHVFDLRSVCV
jgi:hypothetical protein